MADNKGGKPNNELYDLNDLLSGVEASEDSLEDIMAEVYGTTPPAKPEPEPPAEPAPGPEEEEEEAPVPDLVAPTAWKTEPPPEVPVPPVVRDDDPDQPDVLSDPEPPKAKGKVVAFPTPVPQPEEEDEEEEVPPAKPELPPVIVEDALDADDGARPDGVTPGKKARSRQERQAVQDRKEEYRASAPEPEEEEEGDQPPSRFARWRSKADAFADNMFSQAATVDEDMDMAERYIPGTDEEQQPKPAKKRKKLRRERPMEEDIHPHDLSRIYFTGLNFMNRRIVFLIMLAVVNGYLAVAHSGLLPLPSALGNDLLVAAISLWLLGWSVVLSLDVIWMGFGCLADGLFTLHTVGSCAVVMTVLDAALYCAVGREGPLPYCAPACLLLLCLTWGAYDKKLANYKACRQASMSQEPCRVTKDEMLWNARDTFTKERGDWRDYGAQMQAPTGSDLAQTRIAPIILLAAILLALLASVARGRGAMFPWTLSAILISTSPLSALLCHSQPWLRLTRRLAKAGAAVAGWPGVRSCAGNAGVLISDLDLFPSGAVQFNGIKVYGDISLEKLAGCAASLIRTSESDLTDLFDGLVRTQGGFYRRVDNFKCYEAGGLSGDIRGEHIMVGSAAFMTVMDIPLPQDLKVKNAVFCAIDGSLRGIFALNYAKTNSTRPAVLNLLQSKLVPVLVPRDFNVTPAMIRQKLKIPVEKMEYPPVERRFELTETDQDHDLTLTALLTRNNVESYSDTIVGCRRLRSAIRASTALSIVASLVGLVLSFYLTTMQAYASLESVNVLVFLVLWLIPTLMISGNVNRY